MGIVWSSEFLSLACLSYFSCPFKAQSGVLPLQGVKRLFGDAHLSADVHHRRAAFSLSQGRHDLLFRTPSSSCHRRVLLLGDKKTTPQTFSSSSPWPSFRVLGQVGLVLCKSDEGVRQESAQIKGR